MKTIMCFGDSNTWGFMPDTVQPAIEANNRYPWGVRWTSLLQEALGAEYRVVEEGLNGRTTMFDCPMEDRRNGLKEIDVALMTHAPIDLVVLMLGTNDTKPVFRPTVHLVAHGIERLIARIRTGGRGPGGRDPEILVVAPIRLGEGIESQWLASEFDNSSLALDKKLAPAYRAVAEAAGAHFLDAGAQITADPADCVHMNAEGHAQFAKLLCPEIRRILG